MNTLYIPPPPRQLIHLILDKIIPYCDLKNDHVILDKTMQFLANPMFIQETKEEKSSVIQYDFLACLIPLSGYAEEKIYKEFVQTEVNKMLKLTYQMDDIVSLMSKLENIREQIPYFCKSKSFFDREAKPANTFWFKIYNQCIERVFELGEQGKMLQNRRFDELQYWKPDFSKVLETKMNAFKARQNANHNP